MTWEGMGLIVIFLPSSQDGTPKPPEAKKAKKPAWKYVDLPITSVTSSATKKEIVDLREIEVDI